MPGQEPAGAWCNAALATRVWDRSPALAWLLDVPPPALFREAADRWKYQHEQGETPDDRRPE
jgi:hypothetical protein